MVLHGFADRLPIETLQVFAKSYPEIALLSIFCFFAFTAWRVWRFSIFPLWYRDDPKELPYWIPGRSNLDHSCHLDLP